MMMCWIETACFKAHSGLQFIKFVEEAKYYYKYFGDTQTVKHSVVTHFKLCSNSQESQTQNSELGVFCTYCSYYRWSQGQKVILS